MADTVTIAELDSVCAILSADLKLKIIPGRNWGWDREGRRVVIPRGSLLNRPTTEVIGELWRCVWHAAKSWGDLREFDVAVDAAVSAEDLLGVRAVHPRWILNVVMAAERERVEVLAREQARYLEETYLPVRWQGHRTPEAVVDAMALYEHGTTADAARYWARTAVAVGAAAAGVLEHAQLPADMPWSTTTFDAVRELVKAPSYDELLLAVEALVPDFVRAQLEALSQQNEPEEEPEGDPAPGGGSSDGNETQRDQDDSDPSDSDEQSDDADHGDDEGDNADGDRDDNGGDEKAADGDEGDGDQEDDERDNADGDRDDNGGNEKAADGDEGDGDQEDDERDNAGDESADDSSEADSADDGSEADSKRASDSDSDQEDGDQNPADGQSGDGDEDAQTGVAGSGGGTNGASAGQQDTNGANAPADPKAGIPQEVLDAIRDAIDAVGADPTAIDWFDSDPNATPEEAAKDIAQALKEAAACAESEFRQHGGPAWAAVSRSNATIMEPLRRTLLDFLAVNDSGELERHQRRGRLDVRAVAKPEPDPRHAFRRRTIPAERSYAIALVVDRSGSTSLATDAPSAEEAFGPGAAARWHVGTRMVVGLTEALQRVDHTEIAIFAFDDDVEKLKGIKARLSEHEKQTIMDAMVPQGCTVVSPAMEAALTELNASSAAEKLVIVLTDGEFEPSEAPQIRSAVTRADRAGIGMAVLTIGCSADSAAPFVGSHMATEITPETAGSVVRGHFRRLFPPKAAA